ncbi:hypothetical protein CVT26_011604 [Gymnopilus dilepis]|uniref:Uncharacterized protein n=1 Tax=Gymnopilus dilepis TaxID=231916 RepID=A0A409YQY6_9AGAR|nr:hypothetical protein CVT26_011604 [Gymnopilus dilepis]
MFNPDDVVKGLNSRKKVVIVSPKVLYNDLRSLTWWWWLSTGIRGFEKDCHQGTFASLKNIAGVIVDEVHWAMGSLDFERPTLFPPHAAFFATSGSPEPR